MHQKQGQDRLRRIGQVGAIVLALLFAFRSPARAAEETRIGGSTAALSTMRLLADKFSQNNPGVKITTIASLGSVGGIRAVSSGALELAVVSRLLTENERKLGLSQLEYARTPFVFAVSTVSDVSEVTRQELADIYSGKTVKWPDGTRVRVVLRPANNMNTAIVKGIGPEIEQGVLLAQKRPGVQFVVTDQEAADSLERIPGAIGPTTLAVILSERRSLRALKLDGVEPTPANAAAKLYPLYKPLYLVSGAKPSAAAERFVAFVQSAAGRKILSQNGHWIP